MPLISHGTALRRVLVVPLAAGLSVGLLVACGGADSADESTASGSTAAGTSASPEPSGSADAGSGDGSQDAGGRTPGETVDAREVLEPLAAAVVAAGTVRGEIVTESPEGQLTADVAYDFTVPGARLSAEISGEDAPVPAGEGPVQLDGLLLPGEVYFTIEGMTSGWLRVPTDGEGAANPFADVTEELDVTEIVEQLPPDTVLTYEGREDVGGVSAERWSAEVDPAQVSGLSRIEYWVGPDDLPVRFATTIDDPEGSVQVDYLEWGAPVDLTPPPEADVSDLSDLPIPPGS